MARWRWAAVAGVMALVALGGLALAMGTLAPGASAAGQAEVKLTGPADEQSTSAPFNVTVTLTRADVTWGGYSVQIAYDKSVLQVKDVAAQPLAECQDPNWGVSGEPAQEPTLVVGCAFQETTATGPMFTVTFGCLKDGASVLHLVTMAEDSILGTTLFDLDSVSIPTDLVDLPNVTCGAGGPVATVPIPTRRPLTDVQTAIAGGYTPAPGSTAAAGTPAPAGTASGSQTPGAGGTASRTAPARGTAAAGGTAAASGTAGSSVLAPPARTSTAAARAVAGDDSSDGGSSNTGVIVAIIAAVVVVAAAGAGFVFWRSRIAGR